MTTAETAPPPAPADCRTTNRVDTSTTTRLDTAVRLRVRDATADRPERRIHISGILSALQTAQGGGPISRAVVETSLARLVRLGDVTALPGDNWTTDRAPRR